MARQGLERAATEAERCNTLKRWEVCTFHNLISPRSQFAIMASMLLIYVFIGHSGGN